MPSKDSKTNFALLRDKILSKNGKNYWRSVEEFVDAPEFAEFVSREYPQHAEEWSDSFSRRNFIKIMGASLALAGLSGCVIQPAEKIVPYVKQPEEIVPGKPLYFATAMTLGGIATGLLGRSNEGRPTKVEGNPDHVGSLGATDVYAQAEILSLYDPDRSQKILYRNEPKTWQAFVGELRGKIEESRKDGGTGVRFLTETVTSPTLIAQFKQVLAELPNAKWYQYEPINKDNANAGAKLAFGSAVNTICKFDKAERILTLDADIFSGQNVRYLKDFAKGRKVGHGEGHEAEHKMNRLYSVETTFSLTGAKADHRLAIKPSEMEAVAKAIAKAVGVSGATSTYTNKWVEVMAKDLVEHKGKSLVVAGDNQSPVIHALAHAMNDTLGNVGQTVSYTEPLMANAELSQVEGLKALVKDIDAGAVKMLVMIGGNPVYNTPSDVKLSKERLEKVPTKVHVSLAVDETSEICQWHVNGKHFLEMWSDTRAFDGTATIVQPLIAPLYDGKSAHEVIQLFAKENFEKKEIDIVKDFWKTNGLADEKAWRKAVHNGFIENSALAAKTVSLNSGFLGSATNATTGSGKYEVTILPDPCVYDGRYANNGWLQELPNPITKITWDNVALVSPQTAQELTVNQGDNNSTGGVEGTTFVNTKGGNLFSDLVDISYQGGKVSRVPMWIQPGQPDGVITLFMGYGRTKAGRVGTSLGYNVFEAQKSDAMSFGKADITKLNETTTVASSQTHFNLEGRETEILRTFDYENWEKQAKATHQHDEYPKSMFTPHDYSTVKNKWGMNIDLNSCVGCNACVIACQSENNIPVVGKQEVERSREMHWMRVDAYYEGNDINKINSLQFQPMLCQQCEQAPCELVCPVHATVHSAEGLNDMVYNRCIGTRYCSNNCPYKVRRFNFMLYQDWNTPQYKLMRNPEVSVRSRGVMEKCTYCTQRISEARITAEKEGRAVRDGEIVTACEAACPTDAIVFGNLNDKESRVSKLAEDHRNYKVLNSLNTQPRTTYLAGLRNQHKDMPDYNSQDWAEKAIKESVSKAKSKSEGSGH